MNGSCSGYPTYQMCQPEFARREERAQKSSRSLTPGQNSEPGKDIPDADTAIPTFTSCHDTCWPITLLDKDDRDSILYQTREMTMDRKRTGFTLIELLVVIAII